MDDDRIAGQSNQPYEATNEQGVIFPLQSDRCHCFVDLPYFDVKIENLLPNFAVNCKKLLHSRPNIVKCYAKRAEPNTASKTHDIDSSLLHMHLPLKNAFRCNRAPATEVDINRMHRSMQQSSLSINDVNSQKQLRSVSEMQ